MIPIILNVPKIYANALDINILKNYINKNILCDKLKLERGWKIRVIIPNPIIWHFGLKQFLMERDWCHKSTRQFALIKSRNINFLTTQKEIILYLGKK